MIFNSPIFLSFLIVVVAINYWLVPHYRSIFLLAVSFLFIGYFNFESLIAVILFSLFNFYLAKKITDNRFLYVTGIIINVLAIILFNYFSSTPQGLDVSFSFISFNLERFVIALGLAFYSLQNIAYLTEVYFKRLQPETTVSSYLLYNAFFPKIISGPVMLPNEFISQLNKKNIAQEDLIIGFNRFLFGLFKKMVIADRLSPAVHSIFDFGDSYHGLTTLAGAYLFTIQLYFDFSGYTDMALGIAKMLGYDLKENFNLPLRSTSISEFWRRWHISLINWFTNYIYYPLVFRLRSYKKSAALIGILITFLVSGIWHGIGFTFLAWAFCHVIYLSYELLTKRLRINLSEHFNKKVYNSISIFIVFNAVCFSNVFFRAPSFDRAVQLIKNIFDKSFIPKNWLSDFIAPLAIGGHQMDKFNFYISAFIPLLFLIFERKLNLIATNKKINVIFISSVILLIFLFGIFNSGERFIYMQF